ncbi:MAG: hypothetical protein M1816_002023 [Peltula sp. TS41687]|nr:MAG: hypothetical protein M1816_002023 [Peltula sp. TS41687]
MCPGRCKLTAREKLDRNGVEFVRWNETEFRIKNHIMSIFGDQGPAASPSSSDQLHIRAKKILQKTDSNLSEADIISAIAGVAFPPPNEDQVGTQHIWQVQGENFTCDTPRADVVIGYHWAGTLIDNMLQISTVFCSQAFRTTHGIFCGQLAVEFKSSFKGGTTAKALDQVAAATAAISNALDLINDASIRPTAPVQSATSAQASPQPDLDAVDECLRDCLVFGVAIDEYVAYITAAWRSGPDHFQFAKISAHSLIFEAEVLIFLRRVEAIERWILNRHASIMEAVEILCNVVQTARDRG